MRRILPFLQQHTPLAHNIHHSHTETSSVLSTSPRAHLRVVGMLRFMSDTNQPSLPTPFYSVLVSVFCLHGPFNCISFHKFSRQLSVFSFCSSGLISALLVLSTEYLFMKVSLSPDIIPSGCLGSKTPTY